MSLQDQDSLMASLETTYGFEKDSIDERKVLYSLDCKQKVAEDDNGSKYFDTVDKKDGSITVCNTLAPHTVSIELLDVDLFKQLEKLVTDKGFKFRETKGDENIKNNYYYKGTDKDHIECTIKIGVVHFEGEKPTTLIDIRTPKKGNYPYLN